MALDNLELDHEVLESGITPLLINTDIFKMKSIKNNDLNFEI